MIEWQMGGPCPSPRLGRVECLEEAFKSAGSRPDESRKLTSTPFEASRPVLIRNSRAPVAGAHRFDGVDDQVEDHLLQLGPIA